MSRFYYSSTIKNFLSDNKDKIIGKMATANQFSLDDLQKNSWIAQIDILKSNLIDINGHIFFEYSIPRMGKRVDVILLIDDIIFVLEFKIGMDEYSSSSIEQVWDYALDLKNFHKESHNKIIAPILIATDAKVLENNPKIDYDKVLCPLLCSEGNIRKTIISILKLTEKNIKIDSNSWAESEYKPTPTIIEAAQSLYKKHSVEEISRHDADVINLTKTTQCIDQIINNSKQNNKKSICFVTGVPGAGKTLAGLNIAQSRTNIDKKEHAVLLSGNGPLVKVLREALARDRSKELDIKKNRAESEVKSFIQPIHHFRDDQIEAKKAALEKVIIFDEAQRAWDSKQLSKFMKQKKGLINFNMSEPEFLIETMNRHQDWCTVICLIGGGQEINTGEAGIEEWIRIFENKHKEWNVFYSGKIKTILIILRIDLVLMYSKKTTFI